MTISFLMSMDNPYRFRQMILSSIFWITYGSFAVSVIDRLEKQLAAIRLILNDQQLIEDSSNNNF